jgi:hypothetical protein
LGTAINPARGPILKPLKKIKEKKPLKRGGAKPKEAGRRFEREFADRHDMRRVVGSGAFGQIDPMLQGDIVGEIGRLRLLMEAKSWNKVDGQGQKTVTFPLNLMDKIKKEAESLGREPILIFHPKNTNVELAIVPYSWLHNLISRWESEIKTLSDLLDEG